MKQFKAFPYLIAALVLVVIFAIRIYSAQKDVLNKGETACTNGSAILLNSSTSPEAFADYLTSHRYIENDEEALFIARRLIGSIEEGTSRPTGIRDLWRYGIKLDTEGFESIQSFHYLRTRAEQLAGGGEIACGKTAIAEASVSQKYTVKIKNKDGGLHRDTVYICVREHYNELINKEGQIIDCFSKDSIYAWIPVCGKSDIWLPVKDAHGNRRYFSILPVERGFVFGDARGTYHNKHHRFSFIRNEAVLPLLSKTILKQMREDNSILLRSPQEYKEKYISTIALFGALWIVLFLLLASIDKKRNKKSCLELLAVVALISGIGLVNLFNLQNPLWGELFAWSQLYKGILLGAGLMVVCAYIDWTNLYRYLHKAYLSSNWRWPEGIWLAVAAILIAGILLFFGHGPGGTHVNLPLLPVQGSPIIKILLVGYLAIVFACRRDLLEAYSRPGKMWKQLGILVSTILSLLILGMLQLMISDLGPFLVISITAIFIFSLATKETTSMLVGTGCFAASLALATRFIHYSLLPAAVFVVYAAVWSLISYNRYERVKLSPIALGFVVFLAFYGGTLFSFIGQDSIAERLNGRTQISAHIFNNEVVGGSQIAEGIWAVARGGLTGAPQSGLSSTLPAGHTDLVFESLVENMGVLSGVIVLLCIGFLLFTALKTGIRNGHPFGFAFASLIALSIGVQTILIILGSLGIIPLTGISLPFISYGGTALAIDLASIGILISLSRHQDYELELINTKRYEALFQGQIRAYMVLAIVAIAVIMNYGIIARNTTLVRPGMFINNSGDRIVLYNPQIDITKKRLRSGDILDRNGRTLASTEEDGSRIYPYGEAAFFTTGNTETKTLWGTPEKYPAGLLIDYFDISKLRGFNTHPIHLSLTSSRHYSRFLPDIHMSKEEVVTVEDATMLIPMMRSQKAVNKWNEKKDERNIQVTIDADLQSDMSREAGLFIERMMQSGKTTHRTRVGITGIDAVDGSWLFSSMSPIPNEALLRERAIANENIYRDGTPGFKAFSDRDLNLVPLAPGSTFKLLSAGAGLKRFSIALAGVDYNQMVYSDEIVDVSLGEPIGNVSLRWALIGSSNVYFEKLVNRYGEAGLYPELAELCYAVGAGFGDAMPYVLYPDQVITNENSYKTQMVDFGRLAAKKYTLYEQSGKRHRLIDSEYQPCWGQGKVTMTPLSLCRYVAAIANDGKMMYPRYESSDSIRVYKQLFSAEEAQVLQDCMKGQASGRFGDFSKHIGGKTGTPTRTDYAKGKNGKSNDALYCFFVDSEGTTSGHAIAIVIRLERVNDYSRIAMQMAREVVIPVLRSNGYIL